MFIKAVMFIIMLFNLRMVAAASLNLLPFTNCDLSAPKTLSKPTSCILLELQQANFVALFNGLVGNLCKKPSLMMHRQDSV
jgi:hypothetical protein